MALKANKKSVLSPYRLSRLVKGLTQNEASVLVGASPRSLIRYENEENKLTHLGTCRMMKASTLGVILKLTKNSRYSGMALCVNRPKGGS